MKSLQVTDMGRVIADGLSKKGATTLEEVDAQTIRINGAELGSMAQRDVYISEDGPDDGVGEDGDFWLQYED